jgi:predicted oxidoreductase
MRDWKISHQELLSLFKDVIEMGVTTFDPEEAARAFSVLRREGKVLHFGVSNIRPAQTAYSARFSNKQKARSHNSRAS